MRPGFRYGADVQRRFPAGRGDVTTKAWIFMVGDALLVCNVVEKGAGVRSVYLPEGGAFHRLLRGGVYEGAAARR